MFDPYLKKCVEKSKISVPEKCSLYRECKLDESISHIEKWIESDCGSSFHFDPISKTCINSSLSTCGKFDIFILLKNFKRPIWFSIKKH